MLFMILLKTFVISYWFSQNKRSTNICLHLIQKCTLMTNKSVTLLFCEEEPEVIVGIPPFVILHD